MLSSPHLPQPQDFWEAIGTAHTSPQCSLAWGGSTIAVPLAAIQGHTLWQPEPPNKLWKSWPPEELGKAEMGSLRAVSRRESPEELKISLALASTRKPRTLNWITKSAGTEKQRSENKLKSVREITMHDRISAILSHYTVDLLYPKNTDYVRKMKRILSIKHTQGLIIESISKPNFWFCSSACEEPLKTPKNSRVAQTARKCAMFFSQSPLVLEQQPGVCTDHYSSLCSAK